MSADLDDVVVAAEHPKVSVVVSNGGIAGEVNAWKARPVGFLEALGITMNGPRHRGPGLLDHKEALSGLNGLAFLIEDVSRDTGKRLCRGTRFRRGRAGYRRDHRATGLCLPPGVHDGATLFADHAVIPHPCGGIDGLADRTEQTDGRKIAAVRPLVALLDEGADGGG